jgi:hypothetical protein
LFFIGQYINDFCVVSHDNEIIVVREGDVGWMVGWMVCCVAVDVVVYILT